MKIRNADIINILEGLTQLDSKKRLPTKLSFAILKNLKELEPTAKTIDEQRVRICEKYSERDESGKSIIKEDMFVIKDVKGLNDDLSELYSIETEINVHTIGIETIEQCDKNGFDKLSIGELKALEFMIE